MNEKREEELLEKILENTEAVKTAVIKPKKEKGEDKRKDQLQEAQKKFKKVGANFKAEEAEIIEKRCEELEVNTSQYIKKLVEDDLKGSEAQKEPEAIPNHLEEEKELKTAENQSNEALTICQTQKAELARRLKALQAENTQLKERTLKDYLSTWFSQLLNR